MAGGGLWKTRFHKDCRDRSRPRKHCENANRTPRVRSDRIRNFPVLGEFRFTIDACADKDNIKCERFWDITQDGLKQDWSKERCWCNPPFNNIPAFLKKMRTLGIFLLMAFWLSLSSLFGQTASGSGFIIHPDGYLITNHHVIANANQITVVVPGKGSFAASLVADDDCKDLALLKIEASNLAYLPIWLPIRSALGYSQVEPCRRRAVRKWT